jgi:hypothetical protein
VPANAWPATRAPLPFESSLPGVLAAGDVRHGSVASRWRRRRGIGCRRFRPPLPRRAGRLHTRWTPRLA